MPPSIVLEVLKILEEEMDLREETRVAEQAREAIEKAEYTEQAEQLADVQDGLRGRVDEVIERIRELPEGEVEFGKEIRLLQTVGAVMQEASQILARPDTGPPAIGAETEVIELLLQSRRFNPGGGGGGANPGGGGGGTTVDSALALLGKGTNENEARQQRGVAQTVGTTGPALPEEFRAGLDQYFNRLEQPSGTSGLE